MKKILCLLFMLILLIPFNIKAEEKKVNLYLFYGKGCPHCKELENFLDEYLKEKDNLELYTYEIWNDNTNKIHLKNIVEILDIQFTGVPYLVIGNSSIVGFSKDYTEERIINTVNYYEKVKYQDKVGIYLGVVDKDDSDTIKEDNNFISIPKNIKNIIDKSPLFLSSIVIGLVDGFNPCAMWILLFLISMLFGVKDKKRKWILGILFILSSGLVYFLFLISTLNLVVFLDKIILFRAIISIASISFGFVCVYRYFKSLNEDVGCDVVNKNRRKKIILSIKRIIKEKSLILSMIGIVILASCVNIIELFCSLGLPVVFTEILSLNNVNSTMKIVYSIIYCIAFLIDDILVFIISMNALELKTVSNKLGKYAHLIGGLIMILIGFLMAYKPEWLMFNF